MKPYEYYDRSSGSYKGLVIDYFDKISKITGLEFKFVMRGNEKDTKDKLENGEIQLLSSNADSSASSQMYPISLTDSYYLSATEIVYNRAVENPLDTSNCVILKNGYPQYQRLAEEQGYTDIVYCDSFEECIREVNSGKADIRVRISDTGVGMNEEFMPHSFEPFVQEQANAKLNYAGTGLGMSIVKSLVELMGGRVAVESKVGEGTCVTVCLRLDYVKDGVQEEKAEHKWQGDTLKNKRALLVEDHPLNAEIAQKLLENQGMIVEHAENGELGVERFVASELSYYDVVLMDIRMPVMDGLEAEKAIRALDRADAKIIPIIAMTANAFDEDVKKSLASGMNAHLAKPINPEELYATIAKYS